MNTRWSFTLSLLVAAVAAGCGSKSDPSPSAAVGTERSAADVVESATESTDTAPPELARHPAQAPPEAVPVSNKVVLGDPSLTAGIPGEGPLKLDEIEAWLDRPENHEPLQIELPLGLAAGQIPAGVLENNPLTRAKIELGRQLYFDTRLSSDNTISCASCHHPEEGYARATRFGIGVEAQEGNRNSPVSYNRILSTLQFWDGRAASLEEQAVGPIANPIEMGNTHEACIETLKGVKGYQLQFARIFGDDGLTIDNVGQAIAAFERVLVTGPSPYDYYEHLRPFLRFTEEDFAEDEELKRDYEQRLAATKEHPMSESALRGHALFFSEKAACSVCHVGANLADEAYHNLGIGMDAENPDLGRYEVTKDDKDRGAFKTPTIRNVVTSAPYMHDGSLETLMDVVEHYVKGGIANPHLSPKMKKLDLTEQDKQDLVAFMEACTGDMPPVEQERLPE